MEVYRSMKKDNPSFKLADAMKAAKKTYKKDRPLSMSVDGGGPSKGPGSRGLRPDSKSITHEADRSRRAKKAKDAAKKAGQGETAKVGKHEKSKNGGGWGNYGY
jgi:hypothetical protein